MPIQIKYDNEIAIALGKSRKEMRWKNRDLMWSLFVQKLSDTHKTPETLAEYLKSDKSRQDEIKDIGGFVGGTLSEGRRRAESVLSRSVITLDIDNASCDFWDNFTMYYDNAAVVYSTHKHSPEKPRLRLIVPLDRPVTPDEYIPIARRIADNLGIDQFDDTTYEPERLMYWPSTPKDIEYYFRYQDGPWLSPDEVLATYHNWKDSTEWPVSDRQGDAIRREIKRQADPLEKTGIVGAFCRTYGIHKAIETFLSDVYEACDVDNRYTYKEGSTAAGLIIYDDKFAYSHHGTDPTSGMLCNAFDLVRVHKFGDKDEYVKKNGTRIDRYPSYLAMEELACNDKPVKRLLMEERQKGALSDFQDVDIPEDSDDSWKDSLNCDKKGNAQSTRNNIVCILENDPAVGRVAFNTFSLSRVFRDELPLWRKKNDTDMAFRDDDEENIRTYLEAKYGIEAKAKISDALGVVARKNAFHPIRDYLENLEWDGVKRVETLFIDYLGVEDCELYRMCTKAALAACVARILTPGVEHDHVIVLVGAQGVGKSKLLAKLAKNRKWFNDSIDIEGNKTAYEGVRGKWIVEMAELVGFKKADTEKLKRFFTSTSDYYRAAYAKYSIDQERQCVFFGTTNDLTFLRDPTGDRRFWPMEVSKERITKNQWKDLTGYEIDQIWAEAKYLLENGQELFLSKDLEKEMDIRRGRYAEDDDWEGIIEKYLNTPLPDNWEDLGDNQRKDYFLSDTDATRAIGTHIRECVCIAEILNECPHLCIRGMVSKVERNRIGAIMRKFQDWRYYPTKAAFGPYGKQKHWKRIEKSDITSEYEVKKDTIF